MTNNQLQQFLIEQGFKESEKSTADSGFGFNELKCYKNIYGNVVDVISCKSYSNEGIETEKTIIRLYKDNNLVLTNTNINNIDKPEDLLKILGCNFENTPVELIDPEKSVYLVTYLTKEGKYKNIIVESANKGYELLDDFAKEINKDNSKPHSILSNDFTITNIFNSSKV